MCSSTPAAHQRKMCVTPASFLLSEVVCTVVVFMKHLSGILVALFFLVESAAAQPRPSSLQALLKGARETAVSVVDAKTGKVLYAYNERAPLKPASVMKLLTSYTALRELGPEYRFKTRVLARGLAGSRAAALYIVGGGDPSFTTEQLWMLVRAMHRRGLKEVGDLFLDPSLFAVSVPPSGARAFEAGSGALAFNFNSLGFEVCPGVRPGVPATVVSEPWEFPLLIRGMITTEAGTASRVAIDPLEGGGCGAIPAFQVSGAIGAASGCLTWYRSVRCPHDYLSRVLAAQLGLIGIRVTGESGIRQAPPDALEVYVHSSPALSRIVEDMNHYSSNFTAEQLAFALDKTSATGKRREAGLDRMKAVLLHLGYQEPEFHVADASGLSHENRMSARIVSRLLVEALADPRIAVEFEKSLAVAGESGTLKKRRMAEGRTVVRAKTGTLDGVSALAGYVRTLLGSTLAFTIIQNGKASQPQRWGLEKKVVKAIAQDF